MKGDDDPTMQEFDLALDCRTSIEVRAFVFFIFTGQSKWSGIAVHHAARQYSVLCCLCTVDCTTIFYVIESHYYYLLEHPQGKPEGPPETQVRGFIKYVEGLIRIFI